VSGDEWHGVPAKVNGIASRSTGGFAMISLRTFSMATLMFALLLAWPLGVPAADAPDAARRQEIETVVREYLRAHPEIRKRCKRWSGGSGGTAEAADRDDRARLAI
jgi:hypothetical protein